MDVDGPTATIRSITMPDLIPYTIGAPLDIEINPNEMTGDSGLGCVWAVFRRILYPCLKRFKIASLVEHLMSYDVKGGNYEKF